MRVGLLVAAVAVAPGPAQPGVPVAAVVARRPPVAVSPCVPGVVVGESNVTIVGRCPYCCARLPAVRGIVGGPPDQHKILKMDAAASIGYKAFG